MNIQPFPPSRAPLVLSGRDVTAVLGPTNTGKTHLAIERMVAHESGLIGLPLRLLAREVYTRVCDKVGAHKVALITGEEKIQPAGARYSVCTVEALPRETDAAFVAIDEVQLANDLERGHIFTDRILHLRGRQETLLLGAATMRSILEKLLRGISVVTRPRLSHLAYAGARKIIRLPRRSAIVAFLAEEVYAIAELIRRQSGGAAVVIGALSPRTRNAQVALYQSGDVDYLVATDAIGMGLNLDVDHVAFAQDRKFDGYQYRDLSAAELGQIAGRAGRHLRDGTFGVTGRVDPFSDELVERIEGHAFDPVRVLQWRTAHFDFSSLDALRRSIDTPAPVEGLTRALPAIDARALEHLAADPDIRALASTPERVALLWEACALPDYRKIAPAQHADLISSMFTDLADQGHVDETYMAEQVRRADSTEGDIDTLSHRIAQIRTWTFVSNRPGWLADPHHWQEKTRLIEDRLSDALHERLTKRFVDRRTSALMRRLRENTMPEAEISAAGDVLVEGHHVGELQGFRFTPDASAGGEDARAVKAAAQKALAVEFDARAERFAAGGNADFALGSDGILRWIGAPVGTLVTADDPLRPRVILLADEQLAGPQRDKVAERADRFVRYQIDTLLKPLSDLRSADHLTGMARGVAFRLIENLGIINRRDIADDVKALDQDARGALRRLGVRFGAYHIFLPALVKPAPAGMMTLLWALANDGKEKPGFGDVVHALSSGRTSVVVDPTFEKAFYRLAGFRILGRRAVRVDILERLADLIRPALSWRPGAGARPDAAYDGRAFMATSPMMSILGANAEDMEEILKGLGYRGDPRPAAEVTAKLKAEDEAERARQAAKAAEASKPAAAVDRPVADAGTAEASADDTSTPSLDNSLREFSHDDPPHKGEGKPSPAAEALEEALEENTSALGEDGSEPGLTSPSMGEVAEGSDAGGGDEGSAEPTVEPAAVETDIVSGAAAETIAENISVLGEDGETPTADPAAVEAAPEPAEPPKPILLWRPAGRFEGRGEGRGRPQGERPPRKAFVRNDQPGAAGAAASPTGERPEGERSGGERAGGRPERGPRKDFRAFRTPDARPAGTGPAEGRAQGNRPNENRPQDDRTGDSRPSGPRRERERSGGERNDRPERRFEGKPRPQREERGERPPQRPREERPAVFDPDSPFAKLAALRDQLKK